ncbi:MAG: amino acid racemase [Acidobacteriota bacterium]|nr:amino acid racemase [Acidobacteriota bacterium]
MKTIGIIGGMGPEAGLDLHRKILEETAAATDQDHLDVVHLSFSSLVDDRTDWLLEGKGDPPSRGIIAMARKLDLIGVSVAGVPCNTAHAHPIMGMVRFMMREAKFKLKLLHLVDETAAYLKQNLPDVKQVGLLATTGTCRAGIYSEAIECRGMEMVLPEDAVQATVHDAIYNPDYGIKAHGGSGNDRAETALQHAAAHLAERGAGVVILGCTELPLVITTPELSGLPAVDPTRILARALIREVDPSRLKPA